MRRSSLSVVTVLLLSSFVLAQHHDAGSAPSAPAPSAPSHASSPSPSSSPSPAPSPTHTSAPSSTSSPAMRTPETHVAPAANPSASSNPAMRDSNSGSPEAPKSDVGRVVPDHKISGENRIVGTPRIGENPPEKEKEGERKPAESDLRKHICIEGPCKEPVPKPVPPESDLRKHICLNGPCTCPAGQTFTKNGCVPNVVNNVPEVPGTCQPGQYWNGASCQISKQCGPGRYWNGVSCSMSAAECAALNAKASGLLTELNALRARLEQSCGANPPASDCDAIKLERAGTRQRYEMLLTEGPSRCADALPPPASFYDEYQ